MLDFVFWHFIWCQICEAQEHFARFTEGVQLPMPQFWGESGPKIVRRLRVIEEQFMRSINFLRRNKAHIMDVKSTHWHHSNTQLVHVSHKDFWSFITPPTFQKE